MCTWGQHSYSSISITRYAIWVLCIKRRLLYYDKNAWKGKLTMSMPNSIVQISSLRHGQHSIPHLTLHSLSAAVGIGDMVYCGMGVVTWFTAPTNQMHSARSVPHFTFRIPQFRIKHLPTPVSVGVRTPLIARLLFSMTPTLVVFVYYYLCIIFTLVLHYQLSYIKEFTCNTQQTNLSENSCKHTPNHSINRTRKNRVYLNTEIHRNWTQSDSRQTQKPAKHPHHHTTSRPTLHIFKERTQVRICICV